MGLINDAITVLEAIPSDLVLPAGTNSGYTSETVDPRAAETSIEQDGFNISAAAPPVSTTKGSRKKNNEGEEGPEPHFQRPKEKKKRRCLKCGKLAPGHNAATCDRVQKMQSEGVTKRPRGSGRGRGTKAGGREEEMLRVKVFITQTMIWIMKCK